jgi:hypothetical protein
MKYTRASIMLIQATKERVMKQADPFTEEGVAIIEFLLNEKGFTMDEDKIDYGE